MNEQPPKAIFKATSRQTGEVVWIDDLYWFEEQGVRDMFGEDHFGEFWELEFVWRKGQIDYSDILEQEVKASAEAYKRQQDLSDDGGIPTYKLD